MIILLLALLGIDLPPGRCPGMFHVDKTRSDGRFTCSWLQHEMSDAEFPKLLNRLDVELSLDCPVGHRLITRLDASGVQCVKVRIDEHGTAWVGG